MLLKTVIWFGLAVFCTFRCIVGGVQGRVGLILCGEGDARLCRLVHGRCYPGSEFGSLWQLFSTWILIDRAVFDGEDEGGFLVKGASRTLESIGYR